MSTTKCWWRGLRTPPNVPRRARAAGGAAKRSRRPAGLLRFRAAAAAAAAVWVVAALLVSTPRGCWGAIASPRRSEAVEPPWRGSTSALSNLKKRPSTAGVSPPQRGRPSRRRPLTAASPLSTGAATERVTAVRQRAPAASPQPVSYSGDYAQLELPRRKTGEVYYYTRLVLSEPASSQSGSNFGITILRTAMAMRLGGFPAERVVMVHVFDLSSAPTPETTTRSVSLFLALAPARLPQGRIDAFNEAVATGTFNRDLRAVIPAGTINASLFSVRPDRPLVMDRASMRTHGPSGKPLSSDGEPAEAPPGTKSKVPIIVGIVGAVVAVAAFAGIGWCVHSRRSAARVASPRDLTRYSEEESGTRQSSFPSSLASLPLPSFRGSIERVRKAHPDDNDGAK